MGITIHSLNEEKKKIKHLKYGIESNSDIIFSIRHLSIEYSRTSHGNRIQQCNKEWHMMNAMTIADINSILCTQTFSTVIVNPFIFWHSTPNQYVRFRPIDCITKQQCFCFGFYFWFLYRWRLAQWCCWSVNSSHAIICIYGICSRRNTINCRAMGNMSAIQLIRLIREKLKKKKSFKTLPSEHINTRHAILQINLPFILCQL